MPFLRVCLIFLLTVFAMPTLGFSQEALSLSGGQRWLVFASRQDATEAVQLAEGYKDALQSTAYEDKVRVVRSDNGWFAVVVGPAHFKSIRLARAEFDTVLPEDAYLSRGRRYVETVWPDRDRQFDEFENQAHFTLELEKLRVNADLIVEQTDPNDAFSKNSHVRIAGWVGRDKVFSFETEPSYYPEYGQSVEVIRLANETELPQVVIKRFTGGAHCCVEQHIITQDRNGGWAMVQGAVLDGAYGYSFEDLDGDGSVELVRSDNSFLYLFAPYAGSFAPLFVEKLSFDEIMDANLDPAYQPAFRKELAYLEERAQSDPALWGENGFLAAWAAVRARLGEGMAAIDEATEKSRGDEDDFRKFVCPDGSPSSACDYENAIALPFPIGLTVHLIEQGYLPVRPRP
ncbi:Y4bJ [Pseudovibrio sp. JE062]|nr:Y4bJ [Pseudovibrio sp. JE062]